MESQRDTHFWTETNDWVGPQDILIELQEPTTFACGKSVTFAQSSSSGSESPREIRTGTKAVDGDITKEGEIEASDGLGHRARGCTKFSAFGM